MHDFRPAYYYARRANKNPYFPGTLKFCKIEKI